MKADRHRHLAERITRSVARCGDGDWEMTIEAAMLAGTHWANHALHCRAVSDPDEDIVHTSMLVVNTLRKYSIVEPELLRALGEIEELRPLYVRGDVEGGPAAAERALALLAEIAAHARQAETSTTRRIS
ncbi:hypothetical protein GCM10023094_00680 [Rhodococcus olei]|uniref:Uncharacterized protein n=1 Tax=Rhodococcus olei TaxID=2161675 RepID=A0ABP8NT79_9NOCA